MAGGAAGAFLRTLRLSRGVGVGLMALVLAVQVGLGDTEDLPWRHGWWDVLHNVAPRDRGDPAAAPAVVVAIDEATREAGGSWPWPRNKLAELVERVSALGAAAIASDIILTEPDPQSPVRLAEDFSDRADRMMMDAVRALAAGNVELGAALDAGVQHFGRAADALGPLGDWDTVLRDTLRGVPGDPRYPGIPTVLPVPGVPTLTEAVKGQGCGFPPPPILGTGDGAAIARGFEAADPPLEMLTAQRPGLAEVALAAIDFPASRDFVVRRVKALQRICETRMLLLGAEAVRLARGHQVARVAPTITGLRVSLGDPAEAGALSFPLERDGSFWLHYGALGSQAEVAQRYISAQSLFAPDFPPDRLAGKVVLLAVIDLGRIDERRSPLGDIIWGVEAHVQMIEQIVAGDFLRRPWFLYAVETALMGVLALAVILLVPSAAPVRALIVLPLVVGGLLALSLPAFKAGLLIDLATPALGLAIVSVGVIGTTLIERDRARFQSEIALVTERADRAFFQGELDAAARIQTALLPPDRLARPGLVDLAAYIQPARSVGGDFFDHAMIDARHLFFLVADVSGKGADASQFMVLSKTLWKSAALRAGPDLPAILSEANAEIARENAATMFVTGLCGVMDLETGDLAYASAGHDAPFLLRPGAAPEQVPRHPAPPLGLVPQLVFAQGKLRLAPGERLCIFTDGVTEAMDPGGALFGLDRLAAALAVLPEDSDSAATVAHVVASVEAHTRGAVRSDDLTLMVISRPDAV